MTDYGMVPRLFPGETIFIVGGGPSLTGFDFSCLDGLRRIAVNLTYRDLPDADVLYWSDARFWRWHHREIDGHPGLKFSIMPTNSYPSPDVTHLRRGSMTGLSAAADTLCSGNNSGYAAINLAALLGASRIVLLGFDMRESSQEVDGCPDGQMHHHAEHNVPTTMRGLSKMVGNFPSLVTPLAELGIVVYNTSVHSAIRCFPKVPLETILETAAMSPQDSPDDPDPSTDDAPEPLPCAAGQKWSINDGGFLLVDSVSSKAAKVRTKTEKKGEWSKPKTRTLTGWAEKHTLIK